MVKAFLQASVEGPGYLGYIGAYRNTSFSIWSYRDI